MKQQALRFAVVGATGFLIDTAVLYAAISIGLGPAIGRLLSFLCAVFFTWQLNRRFTFVAKAASNSQERWAEWLRYLMAMSGGGLVNLVIYALVVSTFTPHPALPLAAVASGSAAGLAFNYASARWWVYNASSDE